jgi:hypothetical protein
MDNDQYPKGKDEKKVGRLISPDIAVHFGN